MFDNGETRRRIASSNIGLHTSIRTDLYHGKCPGNLSLNSQYVYHPTFHSGEQCLKHSTKRHTAYTSTKAFLKFSEGSSYLQNPARVEYNQPTVPKLRTILAIGLLFKLKKMILEVHI